MAYETGVASSTEDLISKLCTFLTSAVIFSSPWTQDKLDTTGNEASLHLDDVYVHFKWDDGTAVAIGVYQSLGYIDAGTDPDSHTNDSGNGNGSASPVTTERRAQFDVAGPWTKYHFYAYEGDNPSVYVVVEETPGVFRHPFGFGNAIKYNDWTGGEFCYAGYWNPNSSYADVPSSPWHSQLLDGNTTATLELQAGTMHIEDMPNGPTDHKWGVFVDDTTLSSDGDGDGRVSLFGTSRGGPWVRELAWIRSSQLNSYKVFMPIQLYYRDTTDTPDEILKLGEMPNIAVVNMANFSPGEEVTVGSDTWMVFPWVRKQYTDSGVPESRHGGYAYKKVANP